MTLKVAQQRSQVRRRRILDAATRVFGHRGLAGASLADVARAARVPLPSVYDYFPDKRALIASIPARNFEELYAVLDRREHRTALDRLSHLYGTTLAYIVDHPGWGRVFFLGIWPSVLARHRVVRRSIDDYALRYVRILRDGAAGGEFRGDLDPYLTATLLLGAMCQLTAVWLLYGRPFDLCDKGAAAFAALRPTFLEGDRS